MPLVIVGAVLLILTSGAEIIAGTRGWLEGEGELPKELILHALVVGAALAPEVRITLHFGLPLTS